MSPNFAPIVEDGDGDDDTVAEVVCGASCQAADRAVNETVAAFTVEQLAVFVVDPCTVITAQGICQNGGVCTGTVDADAANAWYCACTRFWTDAYCTLPVLTIISLTPTSATRFGNVTVTLIGHGYDALAQLTTVTLDGDLDMRHDYKAYTAVTTSSSSSSSSSSGDSVHMATQAFDVDAAGDDDDSALVATDMDNGDFDGFRSMRTLATEVPTTRLFQMSWTLPRFNTTGYKDVRISIRGTAEINQVCVTTLAAVNHFLPCISYQTLTHLLSSFFLFLALPGDDVRRTPVHRAQRLHRGGKVRDDERRV
jgi:hypothetical protein